MPANHYIQHEKQHVVNDLRASVPLSLLIFLRSSEHPRHGIQETGMPRDPGWVRAEGRVFFSRYGTNWSQTRIDPCEHGRRRYRRMGALRSASSRSPRSAIVLSREHSSSFWNRSSKLISNRGRMDMGSWDSAMIAGFVDHGHCRKSSQPSQSPNLDWKLAGKPIAGNRHDGFEVAGAGTQLTVRPVRPSQWKRGATARPNLRSMALALDPTRVPRARTALGNDDVRAPLLPPV